MQRRTTFNVLFVLLVVLSISLLYLMLSLPELNKAPPKAKPKPKYPAGIMNGKFDPDGNVLHFPGNTIISHLPNSSELHISLLAFYDRLKEAPFSHLYTLLPPSSWHVTIFEGVTDKVRKPGYWPNDLPIDASVEECTTVYERRLSAFDLQTPLPYHFTIVDLKPLKGSLSWHVEPQTTDNTALRRLRDRLSDLLKIRAKNHDNYGFHISIGYMLRILTDEQNTEIRAFIEDLLKNIPKEFELGAPEFCTFEDMFAFEPLMYLMNQED